MMKTSGYFTFLLIVLIVLGCKDATTGVVKGAASKPTSNFEVKAGLVISQSDQFALYYTTDGSINFKNSIMLQQSVKGADGEQEIVWNLPAGVFPSQLRLDFGKNQPPQGVQVKWIKLTYRDKMVTMPGTYLFSYFRPDVNTTAANVNTGAVKGKTIDGVTQTPSLYPKEGPLGEILEYLAP